MGIPRGSWVSSCLLVPLAGCSLLLDPGESITVYTALELPQIPVYLRRFNEEHPGLSVQTVRQSSGILTDMILHKRPLAADLIWGLALTNLLEIAQPANDLIEKYAPAGVERIPNAQYRDGEPGRPIDSAAPPSWVGIDIYMAAFCVNRNKLDGKAAAPDGWSSLLKADYRGHLAMPNPRTSGTGYMIVAGLLQNEAALGMPGWDYLAALDDKIALYSDSGRTPCLEAAKADSPIWIGISFDEPATHTAGVEAVFPVEGSTWELETNALIRKDRIKGAARDFLDWSISDSAMESYRQYYPLTTVPSEKLMALPSGYPIKPKLLPTDFRRTSGDRDKTLQEWCSRFCR